MVIPNSISLLPGCQKQSCRKGQSRATTGPAPTVLQALTSSLGKTTAPAPINAPSSPLTSPPLTTLVHSSYPQITQITLTRQKTQHKKAQEAQKRFPSFVLVPFVPLCGSFLFCVIWVICGFSRSLMLRTLTLTLSQGERRTGSTKFTLLAA